MLFSKNNRCCDILVGYVTTSQNPIIFEFHERTDLSLDMNSIFTINEHVNLSRFSCICEPREYTSCMCNASSEFYQSKKFRELKRKNPSTLQPRKQCHPSAIDYRQDLSMMPLL